MIIEDIKNKKILLVGYGRDNQATKDYLLKRIPDLSITVVDAKDGPDYLASQNEYDMALVSPGVPKDLIKIPWESSTNIFFEECQGLIIGVTGTKGKSTTTKLIFDILKAAGKKVSLIGNFGTPLLEGLEIINTPEHIFVVELSSYQLENCHFSPHIAVVTSLFSDHVPHHGILDKYIAAKQNIAVHQKAGDHYVYPQENIVVARWITPAEKHPVEGSYFALNIALATKVASLLHIDQNFIDFAVNAFEPLPHRLEYVGEFKGIKFYDDGAATIPEATISAIEALKNVGTLLVGGQNRGYEFNKLAEIIKYAKIKHIVFFPGTGEIIKRELKRIGAEFDYIETKSMEEAVRYAYKVTPKGTVCLLSTASTSYNLWKNFSEKGDEFQKWVKELGK